MSASAEGFTLNAYIVLDNYEATSLIGEYRHARASVYEQSKDFSANLLIGNTFSNEYIADILRSNGGNQGFTLKSSISLDNNNSTDYIADIIHARVIINSVTSDINANISLDNKSIDEYIADIRRSNNGSQGFTLKSSISVDEKEVAAYLADIIHGRCIIANDTYDYISNITLDNAENSEILADILRQNQGQQGFTLKAITILDNYNDNEAFADMYRSIKADNLPTVKVLYYNGKRYFVYQEYKLHYFILETGNGN